MASVLLLSAAALLAGTVTSSATTDPPWQPINPYLFGFSSYIGPVVNLSFSDSAVLEVARVLRIGSLRYPGGSPSNTWNITSGRWVKGSNGEYEERCDSQPEGTFTPER